MISIITINYPTHSVQVRCSKFEIEHQNDQITRCSWTSESNKKYPLKILWPNIAKIESIYGEDE